jgi:Metallo-peptidase family M12B Reprolysin-like
MKKILLLLVVFITGMAANAQRDCSKKMRKIAGKINPELIQQKKRELGIVADAPYMLKLFVVIFANNDGTDVAATQADVRRQIANMSNFYAPHNICFALGAIQQVNSTALNGMDADDEESLLEPYIRAGYITIFVHNSLFDDEGTLNGNAYGIPNYYLSIVGSAVADTDNISTLAHEMGHCFGLYHTF